MIQIKKTILTLVALLAVTTGAWADEITVTWSSGDTYENNNSKDGVTLSGEKVRYNGSEWQLAYDEEKGTFTTELGNFTNIEINGGYIDGFSGEGWNGRTWTGNAAAVPFEGYITDDYGEKPWTITFTIEPASSASDPSAIKVDWNKTSKTGSFDMPGGNVELEPEYYPQAEFAMSTGPEPYALFPAPIDAIFFATTDQPLVSPGRVADIPGSTDGKKQGTVMFYVSKTNNLTEDQLIALVNEGKCSPEVPNAADIKEACEVYVYYYIKGNDGDTDETTFSDGDFCSYPFHVTIAAEPTYAVTFAEGIDEPTKWTATPNTGLKQGDNVTVTYTGTKKVLGVKAEKKAAAAPRPLAEATAEDLGKIAGADGNIYDTKAAAETAGTTAVAMIAYVGSATEHGTYTHGLAIALANANEGEMNWSTAKSSCEGKTAVTGAAWLLPSQSQWKTMFSANGGNEDDYTGLQTAANNAGGVGTLQQGTTFWTSTESGDNAYSVGLHGMEPKANFYSDPKTNYYYARPVLAF